MKLFDNFGQSINFNIENHYKKIAVNCSGGADSSLLLFMVAKYIQDNNVVDAKISVLTCANDLKHRWNARKAADVINYIVHKLDFNPFDMHYCYYRDKQDSTYFNKIEFALFKENKTDLVISGITSNPLVNDVIIEDARGKMVDLHATGLTERNIEGTAPTLLISEDGHWYVPFVNVDKRFVAEMYKKYDIMDMLDLTRSCEAIPKHSDFRPDFEKNPCGTCWWCLERKWAFGKF